MSEPTQFAAAIPHEPDGLHIVVDKDGDVWQRDSVAVGGTWACTRRKVPSMIGAENRTSWRNLVISFGPLTAVQWRTE